MPRFDDIAGDEGGYIECVSTRQRSQAYVLTWMDDRRFDLALALDSAEVRGVLMTEDGVECGAASASFVSLLPEALGAVKADDWTCPLQPSSSSAPERLPALVLSPPRLYLAHS